MDADDEPIMMHQQPAGIPQPLSREGAPLAGEIILIASGQAPADDTRRALADSVSGLITQAGGRLVNDPTGRPISAQLEQLKSSRADLVVAIGGDGTVNAAGAVAMRLDAPLLIIPSGTMNLVAKDLGLPLDHHMLLPALDRLTTLHIDAAEVNGHVFLHSAVLGVVPKMSVVRERLRDADSVVERLQHAVEFVQAAFSDEPIEVSMHATHGADRRATRSVVVTNNPLEGRGLLSHGRESIAAGCLGVYASAHEGPLAAAKLLATLGTGRLPNDPETLSTTCEALSIEVGADTVSIALDGEVRELTPPLRFHTNPRALKVAVPAATHGGMAP